MSMTIKVPVEDLEKGSSLKERVEKKLSEDKGNAYSIQGLMLEEFGVKKEDIHNKPFGEWKKGQPAMYSRIKWALTTLEKEGKIKSTKHGKAHVFYWAKSDSSI